MYEKPNTHPTVARFVGQTAGDAPSDDAPPSPEGRGIPTAPSPGPQPPTSPAVGSPPPPSGQPDLVRERYEAPEADWVPNVELPTGGGAIRGIGETFEANAFTGSGSMSVPIATPPARGPAPQLALSYASGSGNGPFGLGWSLGLPSISRKTEQELPRYEDGIESDTFLLAGAEELVPELDGSGVRVVRNQTVGSDDYTIYPYRPRVEGAFARIERWVRNSDRDTHWRVLTPDNVTSWYGRDTAARVADPNEPGRVYAWKLEETRDDRGNIVQYEYKAEDATLTGSGVVAENNRDSAAGSYPKRIVYGNRAPDVAADWMFEVVFDYGEHGSVDIPTGEVIATTAEDQVWDQRDDAFSWFRAGFDIRTRRRCQRVLVFHSFTELGPNPQLVRSTDFTYDESESLSKLVTVTPRFYEPGTLTNGYVMAELPALDLTYSSATLDPQLRELDRRGALNLPLGVDGQQFRFVDLEGEGLPGIVTELEGTLHYKRPRGEGRFDALARLPHQVTTAKLGEGALLRDVDGDGRLELETTTGFHRRRASGDWADFVTYDTVPTVDLADPNLQRVDLDGDGLSDLLLVREEGFVWYPSEGERGWGAPHEVPRPVDETDGPALVFADGTGTVFMADMSGDGLSDIVRVRNGAVHYWPNLGRGRFGRRVTMDGSPLFTADPEFDPSRVRLADLDGSGTTDIVYLDDRGARVWLNRSGNGFADAAQIALFPGVDSVTAAEVIDLYGKGTACLVWSTAADWAAPTKILVLDLLPQKPHLLVEADNNMGRQTRLAWESSTKHYLRDKDAGREWITRLPFPVQVVARVETYDAVARRRFVQRYAYHHGYYDGIEREMRGFAMVERWDTESYEEFAPGGLFTLDLFDTVEDNLHQPPVLTRTWFHTGALVGHQGFSQRLAEEYWDGDANAATWRLPDTVLPDGLSGREAAEATRAMRGRMLRQEVYAIDGSADEDNPYTLLEQNFTVRREQERRTNKHGVFLVHEREAITMHYERQTGASALPRIGHAMVLQVDDYGNVERSASVSYPSSSPHTDVPEQGEGAVIITEASFCEVDDVSGTPDVYRAGVPVEGSAWEFIVDWSTWGGAPAPLVLGTIDEDATNGTRVAPDASPTTGQLRRLTTARSYYYNDALSGALPLGQCGTRALPYHSHTAAISEGQRASVFGTDVDATLLTTDGGYVSADSLFWAVSGRQVFDASAFYLPTSGIDPFGNTTTIAYDTHDLFVTSMTDAIGNVVTVSHDYRVLAPDLITDPNGNRSAVSFDIRGVVVASALMGKVGASEGDTLADPTSTFSYDVFAWRDNSEPIWVRTQARETFGSPTTRWLTRYVYTDGSGNPILEKVNAEAGLAPERDAGGVLVLDSNDDPVLVQSDPRWVGTGRTVFDNKGNAVKQYEPYFSSTDAYESEEELREQGVTPLLHYDPLGRLIRTEYPDGTESRVEFSPWHVEHWDRNDTAGASTWYSGRLLLPANDPERLAAESTDDHHDTPMVIRFDAQGRPVVSVADLGGGTTYLTRVELDIEGNVLTVTDARDNTAQTSVHGMLGQVLETDSVDAGERRSMVDVMGTPLRAFDDPTLSRVHRWEYDALRRPTHHWVQPSTGSEVLVTRTVYGETATSPQTNNLRGRTLRVYDGAGLLESVAFDFAGNLLEQERTLMDAHDVVPDWVTLANETTLSGLDTAAASLLDTEVFTTEGTFDAFGRPVTRTTPDGSVTRYAYNDAGLLESVSADVRGATPATDFVDNIDYDVHGRRALIEYANGTNTTYEYDPLSFRLMRVTTERDSDSAVMQDLQYVYDAVGNITSITDGAQQTLYFDNAVVTPDQTFEYDALYRLVEATGREHTSQGQPTESELTPGAHPEASDPAAMRTYTESYTYDEVGNLTLVEHVATGGTWSRGYHYATDGNRLLSTSLPGDTVGTPATYSASYTHDDHGNMTAMPHLAAIDWDYAQRMQHADLGGGGDVWFQYDAAGNRVRKVQVNSAGTAANERIYLGGVEVYRQRDVVSGSLDAVNDERETLHISDDAGRIVMVETLTIDGGTVVSSPANVARYQYGNHLGTVALELDDSAAVISYEEFHPYGGSAYRAVDSTIGVSAKRYRYAGLERDEETGLDHMGARYYAPWLGRWTAADPIGLGDGVNRYAYVSGNPVGMLDPSGTKGTKLDELGADLDAAATEVARQGDSPDSQALEDFQAANEAFHAELGRQSAASRSRTPLGPSRGALAPIASDLPHFRGPVSRSYDEAVEGFSDATNPWWGRAAFFGLATAMSPLALLDKGGEAFLNAPRKAEVAGQLTGRAVMQQDPLLAADDYAAAAAVFSEAFVGVGNVVAPFGSRSTPPSTAVVDDLGAVIDDAAGAARGRGTNETAGSVTNLGTGSTARNAEVFSSVPEGGGLSGVYDHTTGRFVLRPSLDVPAESLPFGYVQQFTGHAAVRADLEAALGGVRDLGARGRLSGFAVVKEPGGLTFKWNSRQINPASHRRDSVPIRLRDEIKDAVSRALDL